MDSLHAVALGLGEGGMPHWGGILQPSADKPGVECEQGFGAKAEFLGAMKNKNVLVGFANYFGDVCIPAEGTI